MRWFKPLTQPSMTPHHQYNNAVGAYIIAVKIKNFKWRRVRDSNSEGFYTQRFSRPPDYQLSQLSILKLWKSFVSKKVNKFDDTQTEKLDPNLWRSGPIVKAFGIATIILRLKTHSNLAQMCHPTLYACDTFPNNWKMFMTNYTKV